MVELAQLEIRIRSLEAVSAEKRLGRLEGRARKTDQTTKRLTKSFISLGNAARALIAGLGIRQLVRYADTFTTIQNRLRIVTNSHSELVAVQRELLDITNRTRQSFKATTELFVRASIASRDLGKSQGELLEFVEKVNKAVIISGATSEESRAGLIQFAQGIASNTLRGDELRSVLEQLPIIADVIAKEFKVTRGELRGLAAEGEITADRIFKAFENSDDILAGFEQTVPTVSQAFEILKNNSIQLIGTFGDAGLTDFVLFLAEAAKGAGFLAENLEEVAEFLGADGLFSENLKNFLGEDLFKQLLDKSDIANFIRSTRDIKDSLAVTEDAIDNTGGTIDNTALRIKQNQEQLAEFQELLKGDPQNRVLLSQIHNLEVELGLLGASNGGLKSAAAEAKNLEATLQKLEEALAADPGNTVLEDKIRSLTGQAGVAAEELTTLGALAEDIDAARSSGRNRLPTKAELTLLGDLEDAQKANSKERLRARDAITDVARAFDEQMLAARDVTGELTLQRDALEFLRGAQAAGSQDAEALTEAFIQQRRELERAVEARQVADDVGRAFGNALNEAADQADEGAVRYKEIFRQLGNDVKDIFFDAFVTQPFEEFVALTAQRASEIDLKAPEGGGEQTQEVIAAQEAAVIQNNAASQSGLTITESAAAAGADMALAIQVAGAGLIRDAAAAAAIIKAANAGSAASSAGGSAQNAGSPAQAAPAQAQGGLIGLPGFDRSTLAAGQAFQQGAVINGQRRIGGRTLGEGGAEAILPLERTSGGALGVRAEGLKGGGQTTVVNNNTVVQNIRTPDADSFRASEGQNISDARRRGRF